MADKGKTTSKELKSISKKTKDDKDIRISIEEIENGFIISKSTEWNDKKTGWQYENKKWYSKENPLASVSFDNDEDDKGLAHVFAD